MHPPHIHLVNFQILDRNGQASHDHERGWKDTLRLDSGDDTRVIMRFDGYRGRYLMHCHNLEHEDYDMMMRFDVVLSSDIDPLGHQGSLIKRGFALGQL